MGREGAGEWGGCLAEQQQRSFSWYGHVFTFGWFFISHCNGNDEKSVLANNQTQSNLDNWTAILDISSRWLSAEQLMDID